jgi:putative transposase
MIVQSHESITTLENLLSWVDLSKSSFYYKSSDGKRGAKPSVCTFRQDGTQVDDTLVIEEIKGILSQEFCCYGYHNITDELREMGYIINHKKVYRLMKEQNLLLGKVISTSGKRQFVKHRKIEAIRPMEYLCLDIKYVWVAGESRNYYLLTVLDVFTRIAIEQIFQKSIRKMDVINIFRRINSAFGIKGVTVRNDNGSQFIANDVKQFLRTAEANQEFTHIATPEENAYIEAFHSIVQREVIDRFEFQGFYEAKLTLQAHRDWYNNRRRHATLGTVPVKKWNGYFGGLLPFDTIYNLKKETISQYLTNHQTNEYICSSTPIYDTRIAQSV